MKKEKEKNLKKTLIAGFIFVASFLAAVGWTTYNSPKAHSYIGFSIGVAAPNFAFSIGSGVNAYYAPAFGYIYGYNGYYYRWMGNYWLYGTAFGGPWYPIPYGFYVPPILIYGPPPPFYNNGPYFRWWAGHVGPWWHANYPGWWARHGAYMGNYHEWNDHMERYYHGRPGPGWRMGPEHEGGGHFRGFHGYWHGHGRDH